MFIDRLTDCFLYIMTVREQIFFLNLKWPSILLANEILTACLRRDYKKIDLRHLVSLCIWLCTTVGIVKRG